MTTDFMTMTWLKKKKWVRIKLATSTDVFCVVDLSRRAIIVPMKHRGPVAGTIKLTEHGHE